MQNRTLLISLNDAHNFLTIQYAIEALRAQNPHQSIHLLTNKYNQSKINILKGVDDITYIDTNFIAQTWSSALFYKDIPLNSFLDSINTIVTNHWECVYTHTMNEVSAYLAGAIRSNRKIGIWVDENQHVKFSSDKLELINECLIPNKIPYLLSDIVGEYSIPKRDSRVEINSELKNIAEQTISKLRENAKPVMAIEVSKLKSYANSAQLAVLIEHYQQSFNTILLVTDKEKSIVNEIQANLESQLQSVCYTIDAASALISNIDLLWTADNSELHIIASLLDVQTVCLRSTTAQQLINHTIYYYDIGIDFCRSQDLLALNVSQKYEIDLINPSQLEIKKIITRSFAGRFANKLTPVSEYVLADAFDMSAEKVALSETVKLTLASLRLVKTGLNTDQNVNDFINYLERICNKSSANALTSVPCAIFKSKIENNSFADQKRQLIEIETWLFDLKNHLKVVTSFLEEQISQSESNFNESRQTK